MTHKSFAKRAKHVNRRGASLLEITACVLAISVGVWLGARYLGLDLQAAAYTALTDAELLDKLPAEWQPAPPPGMEPLTADEQADALSAELDELRTDVAQLSESTAAVSGESITQLSPELLARRDHTLAFWSQLGSIRDEVNRIEASAHEALTQRNVYKVLELRKRAYAYGAKAVAASKSEDVDPQAVQFADQLKNWYERGAGLYGEAMNLWQGENMPVGGLAGDQLLEQVQKQHANEAMLLFQKSDRLREVLFRRYQVAFPALDAASEAN